MNTDAGPLSPFSTPLGKLEVNLLVAGLEAAVGCWIVFAVLTRRSLIPSPAADWSWLFALYALLAFVALFLLGLAWESLAGLGTDLVIKKRGGDYRQWYVTKVKPPDDWGPGQRWMWKSSQAATEFARRRTRILVSRNTAFSFACFGLVLALMLPFVRPPMWGWWFAGSIIGGLSGASLFGWSWLSAHEAWNRAVRDAGDIGPP
jgi:hypothetical protein